MGNTNAKPHPRPRNKKQVHWKAADRPAPPGKPALITTDVSSSNDSLTIRWDLPLRDGGSPITGYLVEYRRYGSSNWLKATQSLCTYPELNVKCLEPGWRYQFRVYAENVVGMSDPSPLSEPMTMMFQKSDITAPRFLEELHDTIALENDKIEFVVHLVGQPSPKVSWYKDGFEIFSSRRTRIVTENDKSVLIIHQGAMSDEGEIRCTITNRAGHASTRALLTLEAPPSIRLPRQYEDGLLFEIGEVIRLKVSIDGRPTPLIFWSQNGESIQNGERYEIENTDRTSILRVGEAIRTDRGEYQIKAVNKLGEDIASFLVTVTDRPSPPGRAKVIMTLGRSVTLSWITPHDDGGCKIGNYIIEYFRIGWNVWLKAATTRQLTTILGDLIEGSEYKFRVKAESPYGVSEPSEESETVFIPDPKRGMLAPPSRGRSQPRDIPPNTPVAAQRKKRSQSSTRNEEKSLFDERGIPIRPVRVKTKSSPSTPELSPRVYRKHDSNTLNNQIFDRASMVRELAYGSPEIKVRRTENYTRNKEDDVNLNYPTKPTLIDDSSTSGDLKSNRMLTDKKLLPEKERSRSRSRSPSPLKQLKEIKQKSLVLLRRSRSPSPSKITNKSPSPRFDMRRKSANEENLTGSTEFMLVLYPELQGKGQRETSVMSFDLEDVPIAPPLSLSAPELGIEPPFIEGLKQSASSTELLHERAMIRFYEEAAAEEAEIQKLKDQSSGERKRSIIPKIQINSKDDQDIVGLETKHSLRRRLSAGGTVPQQVLWAQRRHSLRNSNEFGNIVDSRLYKFPTPLDSSKIKKFKKEDEMLKQTEENPYDEVEGTDYEEISESEDEYLYKKYRDEEPPIRRYEDEDVTYHPRQMISKKDQPFEILSKPNKLPDPNFIPKPILKKREDEAAVKDIRLDPGYISRERSKSLAAEQLQDAANLFKFKTSQENLGTRQRSFSLIPTTDDTSPLPERRGSFSALVGLGQTVAAVARISGVAAAGIVIPNTLLDKKKDEEEAKVVVDHYGDIVKSFNEQRRPFPSPSPKPERKKSVNNIFSVRQVQKQQSVDEDSYEKFLQKLKAEKEQEESDNEEEMKEKVKKEEKIKKEENKLKEEEERDAVKQEKVEISSKKADYMNKIAEDAMKQDVDVKPVGMWDRAIGFFNMGTKTNEDVDTQQTASEDNFNFIKNNENKLTNETEDAEELLDTSLVKSAIPDQFNVAEVSATNQSTDFDLKVDMLVIETEVKLQNTIEQPQIRREVRPSPVDYYSRGRTQSRSPTRRAANSPMPRSSSAAPVKDIRNKYRKSSPSPVPSTRTRKSSSSPSPSNFTARTRKSTPSPSSNVKMRRPSPSPVPFHRISSSSATSSPLHIYSSISKSSLSRSPSPTSSIPSSSMSSSPHKMNAKRTPMMREIMTQTSNAIDPYRSESIQTISMMNNNNQRELIEKASITVKNSVEYVTDLVLFFAACYLYLFSNELLVIPILIVLVYRQLKDAINERIPNWMKRNNKTTKKREKKNKNNETSKE